MANPTQLNRIAKKTDLYRAKLAKASVGELTQPLIISFEARTRGVDSQENVTTPDTTQTVTGDVIFKKKLKNEGTITTLQNTKKALRYDKEHWAIVSCELLQSEGEGFISQIILYDQDGDVAVKHHLPKTPKTRQNFFLEEIYLGS